MAFVCTERSWLRPWDAGVQTLFGLCLTPTKLLLVAFWGRQFNSWEYLLLKHSPTSPSYVSLPIFLVLKHCHSL